MLQSRLDDAACHLIDTVEKGSSNLIPDVVGLTTTTVSDRPMLPDVQILRQRLDCAQHDAELKHAELEKATDLSRALNAKLQAASSRVDHVTNELGLGSSPPVYTSLGEARETLNKQKVEIYCGTPLGSEYIVICYMSFE
jgi:hypothetical protein